MRLKVAPPIVLAALAVLAPPASAALVEGPADVEALDIAQTTSGRCATQALTGPGVVSKTYTAPSNPATLTAQLSGSAAADFDVAIIATSSGQVLAGSAGFGSTESTSAFLTSGEQYAVQVCRRKGTVTGVTRRVFITENVTSERAAARAPARLARVELDSRADATRLQRLGLNAEDVPHDDHWDVYLSSAAEGRKLTAAGLRYRIVKEGRPRRARAAGSFPGLPSGRTTYRTLAEFEEELKALTEQYPTLVRPVTLALPTHDGRQVVGIEIAENVGARDGRPVYVQVGTHHANEWPSTEATLEFGIELIRNYLRDPAYLAQQPFDARRDRIVRLGRTLVIPVLNPDGFHASRMSALFGGSAESKRKNCRTDSMSPYFQCLARTLVQGDRGVDPNRGYGLEWGGPGTSSNPGHGNYSGPGPFTEPELEGFRRLLRDLQVAVLVTNHTSGRLLMRPPGTTLNGPTPDEATMKPIGDAMGEAAGYRSQYSYDLYDTTGSTSDYTYRGLGVFPYTPEIGAGSSHPAYETGFIPEYDGRIVSGQKQGGLREAFTIAGVAAIDPAQHSMLTGSALPGHTLRIGKTIRYRTSDRPNFEGVIRTAQTISEPRVSTMLVPSIGRFSWHVSPSRQPLGFGDTTWRLTCETPAGAVLAERQVEIARGQRVDVGDACVPPPPAPTSAVPGVPEEAPASPGPAPLPTCQAIEPAFRFVGARRRGRGVLIRFGRLIPDEVSVTITQLSRGSTRLRRPRVVRRLARQISFVWSGRDRRGRRVPNGLYEVTLRVVETDDVRRLTLRKRNGRFSLVTTAPARTCG